MQTDGSVVTWGDDEAGADCTGVAKHLISGIQEIVSTNGAFAALRNDGLVVTWGDPRQGGYCLPVREQLAHGVYRITGAREAFTAVKTALEKSGEDLRLVEGNGNEKDTLGKKIVYVMDSNSYPFRQAEVYHQFHDGFMAGEDYDENYHGIKAKALADGRIGKTGCPNRDGTPENVNFEPPRAVKKFVYKS